MRRLFLYMLAAVTVLAALAVVALPGGQETEPEVAGAEGESVAGPDQPPRSRRGRRTVPDRYIVLFRGSVQSPSRETDERERRQGFQARLVYRRAVKGFAAKLSRRQVERLEADPEVALVAPDRRVRALGALAAGDSAPAGVRRLEAASATAARETSGANVAVIDSGIDLDHPDLNAVDGRDCVAPGTPADDDNGHGTHVAGTIGAKNDGSGVVGAAPGTRLYAAKVLDSAGGGTFSSIICGIDWVTATRRDADPANDVAVANLSLGGVGDPVASCATTTDALHKAVCNSTAAGVTYVVAAGNDGWDFDYPIAPDVPAAYPEVLTVTAASDGDGRPGASGTSPSCTAGERDDRYASFSNYALASAGKSHTIAGPGVCIDSTWPGGGYNTISGTSMATPHVAGATALCLNEAGTNGPCAGLTPAQVVQKMRTDAENHAKAQACDGFTGDPLHPVGSAYFGHLGWVGVGGTAASGMARCQPLGFATTGAVYGGTGHISRLYENDGARVEISAASTSSGYVSELRPYARMSSAQRASLKKLTVDYDGHATSWSASLTLRIFNFATGTWQTIDGPRTGVTADRAFTWSNATSPGSYVSSTGEVRVSVLGRSSGSFRTRTDLIRLSIDS